MIQNFSPNITERIGSMPFTLKFKILVFQDGEFSEEVEVIQTFKIGLELAEVMATFAAHETPKFEGDDTALIDGQLTNISDRIAARIGSPHKLNLPSIKNGYGPGTNLVIVEIKEFDPPGLGLVGL